MPIEQYVNKVKAEKELENDKHLLGVENALVTAYADVQNCFNEQLDPQEYSTLNKIFVDTKLDIAGRTILKFNLADDHTTKIVKAIKSYMLTFYNDLKNDGKIPNKYSFTYDPIAYSYSFNHHGKGTYLTLNSCSPHMTIQLEPTELRKKDYKLRIDFDSSDMDIDNLGQWIIDSEGIEMTLTVE